MKKKKKKSGIVVRLIDVVLILLFGFISISQIDDASMVDLPISSETKLATPDTENLIPISIYHRRGNQWIYLVENETKSLSNIDAVHLYLKNKQRFYKRDIRVKIYSEGMAPIKYTMQLTDLCEQLKLKKSLIVKLQSRQSGLQTSLE